MPLKWEVPVPCGQDLKTSHKAYDPCQVPKLWILRELPSRMVLQQSPMRQFQHLLHKLHPQLWIRQHPLQSLEERLRGETMKYQDQYEWSYTTNIATLVGTKNL